LESLEFIYPDKDIESGIKDSNITREQIKDLDEYGEY
jgi:hypothetical protein